MKQNSFITVVARIRAKQGKEKEVRTELMKLVPITRAEEGCVQYDLHESPADPKLFLFYENWASKAALDKHLASAHVGNLLKRTPELLAEPADIAVWNKIGAPEFVKR